jgi:hypothetical protein
MVNDRSYFQSFTPTNERCHFADSAVNVAVAGKGTVQLRTADGSLQLLKNVLYVPCFSVNLISLPKAALHDLHGTWGKRGLTMKIPSGPVLIHSSLRDGLYHPDCSARRFHHKSPRAPIAVTADSSAHPFAAVVKPDAILVHRRFGHAGMSTLAKMARSAVADNLPLVFQFEAVLKQPSFCGACQERGQTKSSFPRTPLSKKEVVPYAKLHVAIAGSRTTSLGCSRYFTT